MRLWTPWLLLAAGCRATALGGPSLEAVEPAVSFEGTSASVVLRGSGFVAASRADFATGSIAVDAEFDAWLGSSPLADVHRLDASHLSATVPATLAAGDYDVVVRVPGGAHLRLDAAFHVRPDYCAYAADADGDGFVAVACGGDDCDDTPAPVGCGAACHPGALEVCDGWDNDCNPATPDGAGEPLRGEACDGPDTDLCLDDVYVCTAGALVCSTGPDGVEGPPGSPSCSDGIDNDCDGSADTFGVGALPPDPKCAANLPPVVALRVSPAAGDLTTSFALDAGATLDDRDLQAALRFDWSFGDGSSQADGGPTVSHTFPSAGVYRVWATATDTEGLSSSSAFDVVVAGPGALFVADSEDALRTAVTAGGYEVVLVPPGTVITLTGPLTVSVGVSLVGDGAVVEGGFTSALPCVELDADGVFFAGFEIRGCKIALRVGGGTGSQVARCHIHDNTKNAVVWAAAGNTFGPDNEVGPHRGKPITGVEVHAAGVFLGNRIHDNGGNGLSILQGPVAGMSRVQGNVVWNNGGSGLYVAAAVDGPAVYSNTFDRNELDGLTILAVSGTQVMDNLLTNNAGWALNPAAGVSLSQDYNDHFPSSTACNACSPGPRSLMVDPRYVGAGAGDYRLSPASMVIDQGIDLGIDVNGPAPGLYSGAKPDLGAWESP